MTFEGYTLDGKCARPFEVACGLMVRRLGLGLGMGNAFLFLFFKVMDIFVLPSWPSLGLVRSPVVCDATCGNVVKCDIMQLSPCT